jgi:hypothetical protein
MRMEVCELGIVFGIENAAKPIAPSITTRCFQSGSYRDGILRLDELTGLDVKHAATRCQHRGSHLSYAWWIRLWLIRV